MAAIYMFFSGRRKKTALISFVVILFLLHFIRIFDNNFWGDEGIAINAAHMTWMNMLKEVAGNGHSPFHYIMLWISCSVFGYSGVIYHFVSLIPYLIVLMISLTLIWRWFGIVPVIILTTLASLLENAVVYNVEVRMYSWCQLFIFLAYLAAYRLLETRKGRYYVYLMVSALGAIYCHYFALASMGILYLIILIYLIKTYIRDIWKLIVSGCLVIVGFLPWVVFCYRLKGKVMFDYHIDEVSWSECFEFVFASNSSMLLFSVFTVVFCLVILEGLGVISVLKREEKKLQIDFNFNINSYSVTPELIWMIGGVCAVFGTIAVSKAISSVMFPILVLRYLYPTFIIIWLLMGVCISKCRFKKIVSTALVVIVIISCFPSYLNTLKAEKANNKRLRYTLEMTSEIDENAYITTDIGHFNWTVSQVYYPNTPRRLCRFSSGEEFPEFDLSMGNWLFLSKPASEDIMKGLGNQGCDVEIVVENGYIGTGCVWVYKVVEDAK